METENLKKNIKLYSIKHRKQIKQQKNTEKKVYSVIMYVRTVSESLVNLWNNKSECLF